MKKIVSFVIILGILFLAFQFGVVFFKTNHSIDYKLVVNENEIFIHEEYLKDKNEDYYYFKVSFDKNEFVFDVDNVFNKQKKVVENVLLYNIGDLTCISPIYIKDGNSAEVLCNKDGKQYSYNSIKGDYDLDDFISSINNFNVEDYEDSDKGTNVNRRTVYKDNFYDNENIIVYNYSSLVKITKPSSSIIKFANYDIYNNKLGILIDKYYILPIYENKPEYRGLLIIDVNSEKQEELLFDDELSTNIYINGVVNNKLYLFDKSNFVQYEVDPGKKNYRITGNKSTNAQFYNGKWNTQNIYDFIRQELVFTNKYPIKDNYIEIFESDKCYYYYNNKFEFYKVYKKNLENAVYLFKYDNVEEVKVIDDNIYFIDGDDLYRYDSFGLKKILTNKEFLYNSKNIYSVYFN